MPVERLLKFNIQPVPNCSNVFVSDQGGAFRREPKSPSVLSPRKQYLGLNGYYVINIKRGEKQAPEYVHRLIGETFLGPPLPRQVIRHFDGKPTNNMAQNLLWGSYAENNHDQLRHGTSGCRIHGVVLDEDKVRAIRWLKKRGFRSVDIAAAFGVKPKMISDVYRYKSWKHVENAKVSSDLQRESR